MLKRAVVVRVAVAVLLLLMLVSFRNYLNITENPAERMSSPPVRVLCMVNTYPAVHATRAATIRATWGRSSYSILSW